MLLDEYGVAADRLRIISLSCVFVPPELSAMPRRRQGLACEFPASRLDSNRFPMTFRKVPRKSICSFDPLELSTTGRLCKHHHQRPAQKLPVFHQDSDHLLQTMRPPPSAHGTTTQSPHPEVFIFQATILQTSTGFKATRQLGSQPPKNRKIKTPKSSVTTVPSREIFTFQASRVQSSCSLLRSSSRQSRRFGFRGQPKQGRSSIGCRSYRGRLHWPLRRLVNPTNGVAIEEDDVMVVSAIASKSSSGITNNPLSFVNGIIKSDPPLFGIFMMEEARMETDKSQVFTKQQPDQITPVMIFHSHCMLRSQVPLFTKPTHYNLMDIGLLKGHVLVIRHMDSVVCINLVDSKPRSPVDLWTPSILPYYVLVPITWNRTGIGTLYPSLLLNIKQFYLALNCRISPTLIMHKFEQPKMDLDHALKKPRWIDKVGIEILKQHQPIEYSSDHTHHFLFRLDLSLNRPSQSKLILFEKPRSPSAPTCASPRMFRVSGCIGTLAFSHVYHRRILICFIFYMWSYLFNLWCWWEFEIMDASPHNSSAGLISMLNTPMASTMTHANRASTLFSDVIKLVLLESQAIYLSFATSIASLPSLGISWSFPSVVYLRILFSVELFSWLWFRRLFILFYVSGIWLYPPILIEMVTELNIGQLV